MKNAIDRKVVSLFFISSIWGSFAFGQETLLEIAKGRAHPYLLVSSQEHKDIIQDCEKEESEESRDTCKKDRIAQRRMESALAYCVNYRDENNSNFRFSQVYSLRSLDATGARPVTRLLDDKEDSLWIDWQEEDLPYIIADVLVCGNQKEEGDIADRNVSPEILSAKTSPIKGRVRRISNAGKDPLQENEATLERKLSTGHSPRRSTGHLFSGDTIGSPRLKGSGGQSPRRVSISSPQTEGSGGQ